MQREKLHEMRNISVKLYSENEMFHWFLNNNNYKSLTETF